MKAVHLELLVEESSMEAFLRALLPRLLPTGRTFEVHPFQGKADLLGKLQGRLLGYAHWLPADWRIVVVVDLDRDDCEKLKRHLEKIAAAAGMLTRSQAGSSRWQLVSRIAIEELEAWYFGDWPAVCRAYPRVPTSIPNQSGYRDSDAIRDSWEAFERILQRYGYFRSGLRKIEVARAVGALIDPTGNRSRSFGKFRDAVVEAIA